MEIDDNNGLLELAEKLRGLTNFSIDLWFNKDLKRPMISKLTLNKPSSNPRSIPGTHGKIKTTDHFLIAPTNREGKTFLVEIHSGANGGVYSYEDLVLRQVMTMPDVIKKILE